MHAIIRKHRLEKGYSKENLAEMAGVSTQTLQRIERGANASTVTLKCIASVLETDFGTLRKEPVMQTQIPQTLPDLPSQEQEAMVYVCDIKAFYLHAVQYGMVMLGLTILNLLTSPGYFWAIWPMLGWGMGAVSHGLSVFEVINPFGDAWEKRQIAKRMNRS